MTRVPFSYPSLETVLVPDIDLSDPLVLLVPLQTRLGDLSLETLIHHAAKCACTQIPPPEEQPDGDDTYF